jgi:hypothetical protein
MSPYRVGMIAAAGVALAASLGLWWYGPGFSRALEVLVFVPGASPPPPLSHPLYASLSGSLFAVSVGLACVMAIAASQTSDFAPLGRLAVGLAGLGMAVGGFALFWAAKHAHSSLQVIATSDVQVKPEEFRAAINELLPTMQIGLTALWATPLGLLLCGLVGFRSSATQGRRVQISWLHAIGLAVIGLLLTLAFAAAIPAALRLPQLLSGLQPIKASEVVGTAGQLLSLGRSVACSC